MDSTVVRRQRGVSMALYQPLKDHTRHKRMRLNICQVPNSAESYLLENLRHQVEGKLID